MQPLADATIRPKNSWVYAALKVRDGHRDLNPIQVAGNWLLFAEPPKLASSEVEIILINGDEEQRAMAAVLPHDQNAIEIPIRLLNR